jgi:hypothetical protein
MRKANPHSQVIVPAEIFEVQNAQYRDVIPLIGVVAAGSGGTDFNVNVSSDGDFYCMFITGTFEALANPAGAVVDTGVTYLSGQLKDGSRNLFSDRVPLDLVLSPGRRRSALSTTVIADPVGNSLFYPMEFEHLWVVNSNITMNIANTSNVDNHFEIAFHGWRLSTSAAAQSLRNRIKTARQQHVAPPTARPMPVPRKPAA